MIVLNFSHPFTDAQIADIEQMTKKSVEAVHDIQCHFDFNEPFPRQISELVRGINLSAKEWQTRPILVNPPAQSFAALLVLAELNGRMGHYPPVVRISPVIGAIPPRFDVYEIVSLDLIRAEARKTR